MPARRADVQVRWILDLVDKATKPMLAADRSVRKSIEQTDRATKLAAQTATRSAQQQAMAAARAARGMNTEARAADHVAGELRDLSTEQAKALTAGNRALAMQARLVTAYGRTARAVEGTSRAQRVAARAQSAATSTGAGLTGGTQRVIAAAAGGGVAAKAIATFAGFEQQMDRVQAVAGATGKQIGAMNAQAIKLGQDTAFSARQAADGMYELSTAGFTANQTMKIIPGTLALASASGVDLAAAAELQASTLRGFGLAAGDAGKVADALATTVNRSAVEMSDLSDSIKYVAPVAKATGQSMDSMLAAMGLMGNVGIKGSQAGTTLRTALVRLTAPTEKAQGALEDFHLKASDLYGPKGLRPLPDILGKIVKGSQGMDKSTRNAALAAIFGREALSGMVAMVEKGPKAFKRSEDALRNSEGTAKRTAKIMRDNVAGAWDQFTGSVETASITLVRKFGPAIKDSLKGAAGAVNDVTKGLLTGAAPGKAAPGRDAASRTEGIGRGPGAGDTEQASLAQRAGAAIRNAAVGIGKVAMSAGRQLLDAFKPAMPFLQNVLLPLLKGIGQGILGSVVGAFKVLIPIIRVGATALGWIGKVAAPLKPVFQGIGTVLGFVFGGPILKGIALLGKLGSVFKIVGVAAKLLAVPVRLLGAVFGGAFRLVGTIASRLAGPLSAAFRGVGSVARTVGGVIGKGFRLWISAHAAVARVLIPGIARTVGRVGSIAKGIIGVLSKPISAAIGVVRGLGGKLFGAGKFIIGRLVAGIRGALGGIKSAFGAVGSFVATLGRSLANWLNDHTPFGDRIHIGIPGPLPDINIKLPRLRQGGRVPILAAGGEVLVENGQAYGIPGDPRRDGTLVMARPGAAVLTGSGQALIGAGASLAEALSAQAPHFAAGGLVRDAFAQGLSSGQGEGGGIMGALRQALVGEPHKKKSTAKSSSRGTAPGDAPGVVRSMLERASKYAGGPYDYGGGHGGFGVRGPRGGFDCSGYASAILGPSVLSSPMAVRHPMQDALVPNAGKWVTVGIRGTSGQNAHTMVRIGSNYYESGGGHGAAKVGGWNGRFDLYHPRGLRRGGTVGAFAAGGRVPRAATLGAQAGHGTGKAFVQILDGLGDALDNAALTRVQSLRAGLLRLARGADGKTLKRIQGAISVAEFELGQRVGRLVASITARTARGERGAGRADRYMRRAGIDPAGVRGLELSLLRTSTNVVPDARRNVTDAKRALRQARRGGASKATLRELEEGVTGAIDALDEAVTVRAEQIRSLITAKAQAQVDAAQFSADVVGAGLTALDIRQRATGVTDTGAGMRERAGAITTSLVPAIAAQASAYAAQAQTAASIGDTSGAQAAYTSWLSAVNDMSSAMADAGDLIKQAAMRDAQDVVDAATHRATLADTGLQRLELEQRLAGTFEQGGKARADYITSTIRPALEAELAALQAQQQAATAQGDQALADQIAEGIAGKQNDLLQAQLDALEQVAENTEPRRFGGTLGFSFGGDTLTDLLVLNGNGA